MRFAIGIVLSLLIGAGCRWTGVALPGPDKMKGVILVVALTVGYVIMGKLLGK
jgi:XapX domain-containing protein